MIHDRAKTWWEEAIDAIGEDGPRPELAARLTSVGRETEQAMLDRSQEILECQCAYGTVDAWGISSHLVSRTPAIRRNVIASGVDTMSADLSQGVTRAIWMPRCGDWPTLRRAQRLMAWTDDLVADHALSLRLPVVWRDGLVAGTGWLRPYADGGRILSERIHPLNVVIDDRWCDDAAPRVLWIRRYLDKHHAVLRAEQLGGESVAEATRRAGSGSGVLSPVAPGSDVDIVEVWEGWRLASSPGEDDGVHVIAVDTAVMLIEGYEWDRLPIASFRPVRASRGYWGQSITARAKPLQWALNDQLDKIDSAQDHHAFGKWVIPPGSSALKTQLTNEPGDIIEAPRPDLVKYFAPEPMPAQAYEHRDWLQAAILAEFAVNEISSQGSIPSNLQSGRAIRTATDTTSRRFIEARREAEAVVTEYAWLATTVQQQIADAADGPTKVFIRRHRVTDEIDWSELAPGEECTIRPFPSSALPNDPAGRHEAIEEMRARGSITDDMYWSLLAIPELESARDEVTGPIDFMRWQLEHCLDGDYMAPWPNSPLERGVSIAESMLHVAARMGATDDVLDLVRMWIGEAEFYLAEAAAPVTPAGPIGPAVMPPDAAALAGAMPGAMPPIPPEMMQ